eukprot:4046520-Karenia_brevis.AAC.1
MGLKVSPGPCEAKQSSSVVVENEPPLPITITERDFVAVGCNQEEIPTLEACTRVLAAQDQFCQALDWSGVGKDTEKVVSSPKDGTATLIMIRCVPRFASCSPSELSEDWKDLP